MATKILFFGIGFLIGFIFCLVLLSLCKYAGKCVYQNDDGTCQKTNEIVV